MPNYDGTGPQGKGPLSGRGMGDCEEVEDIEEVEELSEELRFKLAQKLVKIAQELTADQIKYRDFFNNKMEEWGIEDPSELNEKQRKKFFNEIEVEWDEDKSEPADAEVIR